MPGFVGVMIFVIIPLIELVDWSFFDSSHGRFVGISNYIDVIENEAFRIAVKNTVSFLSISIVLLVIISLLVSVCLKEMDNIWLRIAFLTPLAIPSNALVVVLKLLFGDKGLVNSSIVNMNFGKPISYFQGMGAFWLLVGFFVFKNIGYNMMIWMSGLAAIPKEIYEAAKVDGANEWISFFKITLPNIRRTTFIVVILSLVNGLKCFREIYLLEGNYPDESIYQLQHLFNNWFRGLAMDKLAAGAVLVALGFFTIILFIYFAVLGHCKLSNKKI